MRKPMRQTLSVGHAVMVHDKMRCKQEENSDDFSFFFTNERLKCEPYVKSSLLTLYKMGEEYEYFEKHI